VPSYLVETFLARGAAGERQSRERRARSAAEAMTREGTRVGFEGSIHVPEDEICFFTFAAPSGREAALVAKRARLEPLRVVEAIQSSRKEGKWSASPLSSLFSRQPAAANEPCGLAEVRAEGAMARRDHDREPRGLLGPVAIRYWSRNAHGR
jgi:hypothetical protein